VPEIPLFLSFVSFALTRRLCERERGINCHFVIAHTDGSLCVFLQGILIISVCEPCAPIRVLLALSRRVWIYYIIRLSVFMHERQRNRSFCVCARRWCCLILSCHLTRSQPDLHANRTRAHQGLWFFTRQTADLRLTAQVKGIRVFESDQFFKLQITAWFVSYNSCVLHFFMQMARWRMVCTELLKKLVISQIFIL